MLSLLQNWAPHYFYGLFISSHRTTANCTWLPNFFLDFQLFGKNSFKRTIPSMSSTNQETQIINCSSRVGDDWRLTGVTYPLELLPEPSALITCCTVWSLRQFLPHVFRSMRNAVCLFDTKLSRGPRAQYFCNLATNFPIPSQEWIVLK